MKCKAAAHGAPPLTPMNHNSGADNRRHPSHDSTKTTWNRLFNNFKHLLNSCFDDVLCIKIYKYDFLFGDDCAVSGFRWWPSVRCMLISSVGVNRTKCDACQGCGSLLSVVSGPLGQAGSPSGRAALVYWTQEDAEVFLSQNVAATIRVSASVSTSHLI